MATETSSGFLPWRAGVVWLAGTIVLLGLILLFAYVIGWPTTLDRCIKDNTCFCEAFNPDDVTRGVKGIRQPVNTWSNLYAIGTTLFVAILMGIDRSKGASKNVMKSSWWVADVWVFAVLFLGLGSMWFHASIAKAVSWMDSMSMFVFAGFLVFYTLDRGFAKRGVSGTTRNLVFLIGYPSTILAATLLQVAGIDSFVLIFTLVLMYVLLEFLYAGFIFDTWAMCFWLIGVFAMQNAILFWALSQSGKPLCDPESSFQPHGLLWHTLAGVMAVMIYLYWRREYTGSDIKPPLKTGASNGDGWA